MNKLKLYLIWQTENDGWDTYDSAVVAANSPKSATKILPASYCRWGDSHPDWASTPDNVKVKYIGKAGASVKDGDIIIASFNAG